MRSFYFLGILFLLAACDESQKTSDSDPILSGFTAPIEKRAVNFSRSTNGQLTLKNGESIEKYRIDFIRDSRTTVITNKSETEIFKGPVYRYRGTFYFSKLSPDSAYWFNAVEIIDNEIKGFLEFETQMRALDDSFSYYFEKPTEQPPYLTKCSPDGISIMTDKKLLKALYDPILAESKTYEIIREDYNASVSDTNATITDNENNLKLELEGLDASLAPNPVADKATITFPEKSKYKFFITDMKGQVKYDERCKCESFEINTSKLVSGNYLLTIIDLNSKEKKVIKFSKR